MLDGRSILITGGTGSFGQKLAETILRRYAPERLIVYSRDELKQFEMRAAFPERTYPALRFAIGDVRDRERLLRACDGVDVLVHAAALKQVPHCEAHPLEAVKTNVLGAANVIDAALERGVERVLALSTDKAAHPANLYGATKLCAEKLFTCPTNDEGGRHTRFAVARYGNVVGSRGSVVPLFLRQRQTGVLTITDPRMTRFWLTLDQAAEFALLCLASMERGEIFVPKLPSMNILDLAQAIAPGCRRKVVGIRPGEKLHEVLVPEEASSHTIERNDCFVILPQMSVWDFGEYAVRGGGRPCPENFRYASDTNAAWLTVEELRSLVALEEAALAA